MKNPRDWTAEGEFQNLTFRVQSMACSCEEPNLVGYEPLEPNYVHRDNSISLEERLHRGLPFGSYCTVCLKPHKYTLKKVLRYCEGCEKTYVPKPERGIYPIKYFLCASCDVPARPRRRKNNS